MKPPFAYFGGKTTMADAIASLLPAHEHYVEPFAGSLAVLLAKRPSKLETVNDLDEHVVTFWRVLRDRPAELIRAAQLTPHARAEMLGVRLDELDGLDDLERARRVWVLLSQSRTGTLRPTGWRHYLDAAGTGTSFPSYLDAYVDRMAACAERLHRVSLECRPALDLIAAYGQHPTTCLYLDPPYLGSTRNQRASRGGARSGYRLEMSDPSAHVELLTAIRRCRAAVVLSGYRSDLYDEHLADWESLDLSTFTTQGGTRSARTEVIYSNRPLHDGALDLGMAVGRA